MTALFERIPRYHVLRPFLGMDPSIRGVNSITIHELMAMYSAKEWARVFTSEESVLNAARSKGFECIRIERPLYQTWEDVGEQMKLAYQSYERTS